jgi:hypothetical protein
MNDAPRRTLRELVARHGPGLCSDARRCEGLLRDLCGEHRREINILVAALRERVPLDLLAGRNSVPTGLLLTRLSKRLEEHLALTEEAARWAVDSWALALGVISDAEEKAIKSRPDEAARSRVGETPTPAAPRPAAEDEARAGKPAASSGTRPPANTSRTQQKPPLQQAPLPPVANPSGSRPFAPPPARPTARAGSNAAAPLNPAAPQPVSPGTVNTGVLQEPSTTAGTRGGRRRWRGCMVGCLLLLLLSVLLAAGAPFVINVLREEQQQRNLETPPGQTR